MAGPEGLSPSSRESSSSESTASSPEATGGSVLLVAEQSQSEGNQELERRAAKWQGAAAVRRSRQRWGGRDEDRELMRKRSEQLRKIEREQYLTEGQAENFTASQVGELLGDKDEYWNSNYLEVADSEGSDSDDYEADTSGGDDSGKED